MVNKHILAFGSGLFASLPFPLVRAPFINSITTNLFTWLFKAFTHKQSV
ncbi:MAG TPA: hypothetical protein VI521_02930 [Candidatus Babeliales bacterium]|nr:hypothetical protein [Candidatus Babeliales bacterium]